MDDYELILAIFHGDREADLALDDLKTREEDGALRIFNAAMLARDENGRAVLHEDQDLSPGIGSVFGALVGGLIGLIGGPGGAIVGAAAGAAVGGSVAGGTDLGFQDRFLKDIQAALKPNSSVLLLLVENRYADAVCSALEARPGGSARVLRHAVRQELIERLRSSLDE